MADAVAYVVSLFDENLDGVLPLLDLRKALAMSDVSNFNKTIRKHSDFMTALEEMLVEEVVTEKSRYPNALTKKKSMFGPVAKASCVTIVND